MRTKTILLTAAVIAAGAATSMAQVFSVNAVGYVNKTVPGGGYALISNPLKAATNTVSALFAGVPDGFKIYKFTPGSGYKIAQFDELEGAFTGEAAGLTVLPGEGVFVQNPLTTPVTVTFVGEVPQGTLTTPLVAGFQIVSSQVPQAGTVKDLGFVGAPGDKVFQFITNDPVPANNQKYWISTFDDLVNDWDPALKSLDVGEAVFVQKVAAGTWTRTFNVNQ